MKQWFLNFEKEGEKKLENGGKRKIEDKKKRKVENGGRRSLKIENRSEKKPWRSPKINRTKDVPLKINKNKSINKENETISKELDESSKILFTLVDQNLENEHN